MAHPLVFEWAVEGSSSPKCLFTSFSSVSTSKEVYLFLIGYRRFIRNPVTTPTSGLHQGMVVYFSFQKREGDSFHELETIEFDLNSQQQPRAD